MKRLLIILLCLPTAALAQVPEFKHLDATRADFLATMEAEGVDSTRCRLEHVESTPAGHVVRVQCAEIREMCLMMVHPTEILVRPIGCTENPNYDPRPSAPKQTL